MANLTTSSLSTLEGPEVYSLENEHIYLGMVLPYLMAGPQPPPQSESLQSDPPAPDPK